MPDLFTLAGALVPVVSVQELPRPIAARRRFDGTVGTDVTVTGDSGSPERPRGWDVVHGDQLTESEADALISTLEAPGFVVIGGVYPLGAVTCRATAVRRTPGALEGQASVAVQYLARYPGPADEPGAG